MDIIIQLHSQKAGALEPVKVSLHKDQLVREAIEQVASPQGPGIETATVTTLAGRDTWQRVAGSWKVQNA